MKLGRLLGVPQNTVPADLSTDEGRRRAIREMLWSDHGFLRVRFRNLHQLSDEMWRCNQPQPHHIERLSADLAIKTIINLRGESHKGYYLLEKEACERLGIQLINYKIRSRDVPSPSVISGARALFESIEYPAVMHCKSGADRAGLMSTLYMIFRANNSVEEARGQLALKYLHMKWGKTGILDHYFDAYLSEYKKTGIEFEEWAKHVENTADMKRNFLSNRSVW